MCHTKYNSTTIFELNEAWDSDWNDYYFIMLVQHHLSVFCLKDSALLLRQSVIFYHFQIIGWSSSILLRRLSVGHLLPFGDNQLVIYYYFDHLPSLTGKFLFIAFQQLH